MELLGIINGITNVGASLVGSFSNLRKGRIERRQRMANLFERVAVVLEDVNAGIVQGDHSRIQGRCSELETYANELPSVIADEVGDETATDLGNLLKANHRIEMLGYITPDGAERNLMLAELQKSAGIFRALTFLVTAQ